MSEARLRHAQRFQKCQRKFEVFWKPDPACWELLYPETLASG